MFLKNDRVDPFWDFGIRSEAVSLLTRCVAVVKEGENYLYKLGENSKSDEGRWRKMKDIQVSLLLFYLLFFVHIGTKYKWLCIENNWTSSTSDT